MVKLISKVSGKVVEQIPYNEFELDEKNFYGKDEFGNTVSWAREAFYAKKEVFIG